MLFRRIHMQRSHPSTLLAIDPLCSKRCIVRVVMRTNLAGIGSFRKFMHVFVSLLALALILTFRALVIGNSPPSEVGAPRALIEATDSDASNAGRPGHAHEGDAQGGAHLKSLNLFSYGWLPWHHTCRHWGVSP